MLTLKQSQKESGDDEFALKEKADEIRRQLTQLVLDGGDLRTITQGLAQSLKRSVLVSNTAFESLASAEGGASDEARRQAMASGRTGAKLAQHLLKRGFYGELQHQMRPLRLAPIPELGMTMERLVAPIIIGGIIHGSIWIVAGEEPLTRLDELVIDHAATVVALVLHKERAVREAQQMIRGDFLGQLLRLDSAPDRLLLERAHLVGYKFDQAHQMVFVIGQLVAGGAMAQLAAQVENCLRHQNQWGLVVAREHGIAVIVESRSGEIGQELGEHLVAEVGHPALPMVVGVGNVYSDDRLFRDAYDQAEEAAEIGRRLYADSRVVCFWELGVLDWLYRLPVEVMQSNPYYQKLQKLAEYDTQTNNELMKTLEMFLEKGGALSELAAALHVHRNTLLFRLGRIEDIIDVDLKSGRQRLNLHSALIGYHLKKPGTHLVS